MRRVGAVLISLTVILLVGCGSNTVDITIFGSNNEKNLYKVTYSVSNNDLGIDNGEINSNEVKDRIYEKLSSDYDIQLFINDNLNGIVETDSIFDKTMLVFSGTVEDIDDIFSISSSNDDDFYKTVMRYNKDIPESYDNLMIRIKVYGKYDGVLTNSWYTCSEFDRYFIITWRPDDSSKEIEVYWNKGEIKDEEIS